MAGAYHSGDAASPYLRAAAVTLSDSTELETTRGIWCGGAGNLKVTMVYGGDVTFEGIVAGTHLPIQITKAWATGSTASATIKVLALY